MPERKSGPVKPPVIEATARTDGPAAGTAEKTEKTEIPRKAARESRPPSPPLLAAGGVIAGALLGTALTGILLAGGWLPVPQLGDDPRLDALQSRLNDSEATLSDLSGQFDALNVDVGGKAAKADLDALQQQLTATPAGGTADVTALSNDVDALAQRIDAVAARSGGPTASEAEINTLKQRVDAINSTLDHLQQDTEAALATLRGQLSAAADRGSEAAQLPLLLVGLAGEFSDGTPFTATLSGIRQLAPDIAVSERLSALASTGLTPRTELARHFAAVLPDMLAAAPATPDAGWQGSAVDWLKGQLALRPTNDPGGDAPEAQVARLEAAMARNDYAEAANLFAALPAPMREAAGEVPAAVAAHADADTLLDSLRQRALAPQAGVAP